MWAGYLLLMAVTVVGGYKFGSEIIFQGGSYPEFDYFKKFQVFDFFKSCSSPKVVTK